MFVEISFDHCICERFVETFDLFHELVFDVFFLFDVSGFFGLYRSELLFKSVLVEVLIKPLCNFVLDLP